MVDMRIGALAAFVKGTCRASRATQPEYFFIVAFVSKWVFGVIVIIKRNAQW